MHCYLYFNLLFNDATLGKKKKDSKCTETVKNKYYLRRMYHHVKVSLPEKFLFRPKGWLLFNEILTS